MAFVQSTTAVGNFSVDRLFGTTGNWQPNVVPVGGDDPLLAGGLVADGIDGVNTELNAAGAGSKLGVFRVAPDWLGDIGSSGNPLRFDADEFRYGSNSRKSAYIQGFIVDFYAEHSSMEDNALVVTHEVTAITRYWAMRGMSVLSPACDVGTLRVIPQRGDDGNCVVIYESGGTIGTEILMTGGRLEYKSTVTLPLLTLLGGVFTHNADASLTKAIVDGGGTLIMKDGGIVEILVFPGGTLDLSQSYQDKTITVLHAMDGANIDLRNFAGTNAVTTLKVYGTPSIIMNNGTSIQI